MQRFVTETMKFNLLEILDQAMAAGGARCGNIQVYNPKTGALEIVVQRGLPPDVAELWRVVHTSATTVCARAWRGRHRFIVPVLAEDPLFAPYLLTTDRIGVKAVQSTPLPGAGDPVGVMSTHYPVTHTPSAAEAAKLDQCAHLAARTIEELAAAA